jgi:hypothetical protein
VRPGSPRAVQQYAVTAQLDVEPVQRGDRHAVWAGWLGVLAVCTQGSRRRRRLRMTPAGLSD